MLQKVTHLDSVRSNGGGNCSDDGGAYEGEPDLHPTQSRGGGDRGSGSLEKS